MRKYIIHYKNQRKNALLIKRAFSNTPTNFSVRLLIYRGNYLNATSADVLSVSVQRWRYQKTAPATRRM